MVSTWGGLGLGCGRAIGDYREKLDAGAGIAPEAVCPEETYAAPGRPATLYGGGDDDVAVVGWGWTVEAGPSGSSAAPSPADRPTTVFDPDVDGDFTLELTVTDTEGLTDQCTTVVHSVVGPPLAFCPDDIDAALEQPVALVGDGFDDVGIVGYAWELLEAPPGSIATITSPQAREAIFIPDVSGTYRMRLTVTDGDGLTGSCEFVIRAGGAPTPLCPDDMTVPTRTEVPVTGDAQDDGVVVSWTWQVVEHNTDTPPRLEPTDTQNTTFWALRVGVYRVRLTVIDDDGQSGFCEFNITTTPTGPTAICPPDTQTLPLTTITLQGDGEDDGQIVGYAWELVSFPPGSAVSPPSPATAQTTSFSPDIVGDYRIRMTVTDDHNNTDSCEFSVFATPGEGLRIEMFWNPPEDPNDRSDVDLHLLHPSATVWFDQLLDCHWMNCNSSSGHVLHWDVAGYLPDNPRLDLDDVDGYGPENINIDEPVSGNVYDVGVHYWADEGQGTAQVYIKIYCGTISVDPVFEAGPKALSPMGGPGGADNDFWKVASVQWNSFDCTVTPIDLVVRTSAAQSGR